MRCVCRFPQPLYIVGIWKYNVHGAVPGLEGSGPAKRREGGPDNFDKNEK